MGIIGQNPIECKCVSKSNLVTCCDPFRIFVYEFEAYSIDALKKRGRFPEVLKLDWLFLKLDW